MLDRVIDTAVALVLAGVAWLTRVVRALELGAARADVSAAELTRRIAALEGRVEALERERRP